MKAKGASPSSIVNHSSQFKCKREKETDRKAQPCSTHAFGFSSLGGKNEARFLLNAPARPSLPPSIKLYIPRPFFVGIFLHFTFSAHGYGLPRTIGHEQTSSHQRIFRTLGKLRTRCACFTKNEFHAERKIQTWTTKIDCIGFSIAMAEDRFPSISSWIGPLIGPNRAFHQHWQPPRSFQLLRHRIKFMFPAGPEQCLPPFFNVPITLGVDAPACEIVG